MLSRRNMKSNEFQDTSNIFWHMSNLDLTGIYYLQQGLVFKLIINNEVFSYTVVYKYYDTKLHKIFSNRDQLLGFDTVLFY